MISRNILSIFTLAFVLVFSSCKKDFGNINVDPSRPAAGELKTRFLLANAIGNGANGIHTIPFSINSANHYVQYLSEGPYPGASLYSVKNFDWAVAFTGPLYDLQKIIDFVDASAPEADESNGAPANQKAVAQILQSYIYIHLTDRFGPMPYTAALKGTADLAPAYTTQQDIYKSVFAVLDAAVKAIDETKAGVAGDLLFHGDMLMWKKFANMLRLHMAINLSKVDAATGKTELNNAISASGSIIKSNSENMEFSYIDDPRYLNPWYTNYTISNRNDYAVSNTLVDYMLKTSDSRIEVYAEKLNGATPYRGLLYGSSAAKNIPGVYSRIGDDFRSKTAPARIYNYPQAEFILAEAAVRGWIPGGATVAKQHYDNANKASWEMNGVYTASAFAAYMAKPDIAFDGSIKQIITQKWVHNYLNGYYAWNDWRRTGFPTLVAAVDAIDTRGIPVRQGYPVTESSLNKDSYNAGVSALGGKDDNYTPLWLYK